MFKKLILSFGLISGLFAYKISNTINLSKQTNADRFKIDIMLVYKNTNINKILTVLNNYQKNPVCEKIIDNEYYITNKNNNYILYDRFTCEYSTDKKINFKLLSIKGTKYRISNPKLYVSEYKKNIIISFLKKEALKNIEQDLKKFNNLIGNCYINNINFKNLIYYRNRILTKSLVRTKSLNIPQPKDIQKNITLKVEYTIRCD